MVSRLDSELRLVSSNKFIASLWRAFVRNLYGTWCSGLLAWSLGYVEVDLADDPGTNPAGSKTASKQTRDSLTITTALEQCQTRFWPMTSQFTQSSYWRGLRASSFERTLGVRLRRQRAWFCVCGRP